MTDRNGKVVLDKNGKPIETREYHFDSPANDGTIVIQEHSAGHSSFDGDAAKPHFNIRRAEDTRHSSIPNTKEHYTFDK